MENLTLADTGAQLSIWALFWQAGWVVKLVMVGLLCASVWTWAIIGETGRPKRFPKEWIDRFMPKG